MKKTHTVRALCCALALLILCAAGCGDDTVPVDPGAVPTEPTAIVEPTGSGFTANHATAAGFGLGADTREDIILRYGEPTGSDTQEYTAMTVVTLDYDFGQFVLQADNGGTPVLTYVYINSRLDAPMGITFGMDIDEALDLVCTGSSAQLGDRSAQSVILYGDGSSAPTGVYTWLTIEYISSSSPERYVADYTADSFEDGKVVNFGVYFDADWKMVRYELQYLAA